MFDFEGVVFVHIAAKAPCKRAVFGVQVLDFARADFPLNGLFSPVVFTDFARAEACGCRSDKCTF